jgi:DNA-binding transcriptional ArsR family regulator
LRSKAISILLLAILATVVVVAINSAGQTPPPASGDWDIYDDTVITNTSVTIQGNVRVYGFASLTLINVDLTLEVTGSPMFQIERWGKLKWSGGSLDHTGTFPLQPISLYYNCTIDGVAFGALYGIFVRELGVTVTNCTFGGTDSIGIQMSPLAGTPTDRPIMIADNTFTNMKRSPIGGRLTPITNDTVGVVIVGNRITGTTSSDAINLTVIGPSAHVVVGDNVVSKGPFGGIALTMNVEDLFLRMNGNSITEVDGDGLRITIDSEDLDFPGIVDLTVDSAGGTGLNIMASGWDTAIDGLVLVNHTNLDAGYAAIALSWAKNVSLIDSRVNTSAANFLVSHSTLDIHNSDHSRYNSLVAFADSRISSWKWVELTCLWQGGIPVRNQRVDVLGPVDQPILSAVTDRNGYWGNQTYSDWTQTEAGSLTADSLTPIMVHPHGNITDGNVSTNSSIYLTILFEDTYVPTLVVKNPVGDVVQNTTAFNISGTSSDPHSGVGLVQFSFDTNPEWDQKIWSDATGTTKWHVDTLYLAEGLYTLYARAFDRASVGTGRFKGIIVGQVLIDLTPPVVQVTSPDARRQPVIVNTTSINVQGWVSEAVSYLEVQGTIVPMTGTLIDIIVDIPEGPSDIIIIASDLAGNTVLFTLSVLRDTAEPKITLTAPAEGALLNVSSVLVVGQLDEPVQGDKVVINGASVTLSSGAFQLLISGFDDGPGTIEVTAVDMAGNTAIMSVDVLIDTLPPALELVSPSDGYLTRQPTVLLEGTSEAGAHISIGGKVATMTGTDFTHEVDLVEGRNIFHVTSADQAGNENSTLIIIHRDSTPPVLDLYGLTDGTIDSEGDNAVLVGQTEPGATLWIAIGGTSFGVLVFPDGSFMQPVVVEANETAVTMRAEDAAGNTAFAEATIIFREIPGAIAPPQVEPVDPVVTVAVVTTTTIIVLGVAMTFEFTKYALVLMVLPLYARIKKHEVLDNKTRLAIHGLVVENPGMHYNEIIREFALTNGVAAYHLDVLEREGFVRSVRDGTLRRFYSSNTKVPGGHKATPDQTREQILEMITANPGINQKSLVHELGIGRTLVGYHLKTLNDVDYIEAHKQGRFTVYSRTRKRWFRLN